MNQRLEHDWFDRPLPPNVHIGERSWLYSSFAFLHYHSRQAIGLRVGNDTGIYNATFFDLGPQGKVEVGSYSAIVGAIIASNRQVIIGDYVFIAHEVVIADSFAATPVVSITSAEQAGGETISSEEATSVAITIGDDVWIGAHVILLAGANIGAGSIIGAGAVVDFEVPAYSIVAGNPARVVSTLRNAQM